MLSSNRKSRLYLTLVWTWVVYFSFGSLLALGLSKSPERIKPRLMGSRIVARGDTNLRAPFSPGRLRAGTQGTLPDDESGALLIGQRVAGSIDQNDDSDVYLFHASPGEAVGIEVNSADGSLDPVVTLFYDPLRNPPIAGGAIPVRLPGGSVPASAALARVALASNPAPLPPRSPRFAFSSGNVFAAVGQGKVKRFTPDGTLLETLDAGVASQYTAGMGFDNDNKIYVTFFSSGSVERFDFDGRYLGPLGPGGYRSPESIAIDLDQNIYVGQAGSSPCGDCPVLKFDRNGTLLDSFPVEVERRGTDWIDLAADQRTLFYTSEGKFIRRYDLQTKTQLANFNAVELPGSFAYALRILPDGSVLVADSEAVHLLNSSGTIIRTYDDVGQDVWFAVNLDPDGRTFWSGNLSSGQVYRFDIATGNVVTTWNAQPFSALGGLSVFGEITAARVLNVSKSAPARANLGDLITYEISYGNSGIQTVKNVVIRDRIPEGATFVSASNGGTLSNGEVTWQIGDLAGGTGGLTVTLTVRVNIDFGSIVNSVYSIDGDQLPEVAGAATTTVVGEILAVHDDNSGPGKNALIQVRRLPAGGYYRILVGSARAESSGGYELVLSPLDKDSNGVAIRAETNPVSVGAYSTASQNRKIFTAGGVASTFLAYSPDGSTAAVARETNPPSISVYDARQPNRILFSVGGVESDFLGFAPDGKSVAFGRSTNPASVRVHSTESGNVLFDAGGVASSFLGFSPDGGAVAVSQETNPVSVRVYSTRNGGSLLFSAGGVATNFLAFSPEGSRAAVARQTNPPSIQVYDSRNSGDLIFTAGGVETTFAGFSPDGDSAAVVRETNPISVQVYDTRDKSLVFTAGGTATNFLGFSGDGDSAAVSQATNPPSVAVYSTRENENRIFSAGGVETTFLEFAPDGETVALDRSTNPASIQIRNARTGSVVIDAGGVETDFLAFAPDGAGVAVTRMTNPVSVQLFNTRNGNSIFSVGGVSTAFVGFSPDAKAVGLGRATNPPSVDVYSTVDGGRILSSGGVSNTFLGFSPDGSRIAVSEATNPVSVTVLNTRTGSAVFSAGGVASTFLGFSPDSNTAAVARATNPESVNLYSTRTPNQVIFSDGGVTSTFLGFSPDAESVALSRQTNPVSLRVYDTRSMNRAVFTAGGVATTLGGFSLDGDSIAVNRATNPVSVQTYSTHESNRVLFTAGGVASFLTGFSFDRIGDRIFRESGTTLDFPVLRGNNRFFTGLAELNLGSKASLELRAYQENADFVPALTNPTSTTLEAFRQFSLLANDIFSFTPQSVEGWVQTRVDTTSIVGFGLIGSFDGQLLDGFSFDNRKSASLILTTVEENNIFTTELHVANPGIEAANVTMELRRPNGTIADSIDRVINAKAKFSGTVGETFQVSNPFSGYLTLSSDQQLSAAALYLSDRAMAALKAQPLPDDLSQPSQLYSAQAASAEGVLFTRVTVVNPCESATSARFRLIGNNGSELAAPVNRQLAAGEQFQQDLGRLFNLGGGVTEGSLVVEGGCGLVGDVFFGEPEAAAAQGVSGPRFRATLPLDQGVSDFSAYAHIANAAGFFTGYTGFNPNEVASGVTVAVFKADHEEVGRASFEVPANGRFAETLVNRIPASAGMAGGYFTVESTQPMTGFALFGPSTLEALSAISSLRFGTSIEPPPNNPVPQISSLNPTSISQGSDGFDLTVNGSGFVSGSTVRWDGSDRATTFVNGGRLMAAIPASDLVDARTLEVTVFNPPPGGGTSAPRNFMVLANNPVPSVSTISPESVEAGSGAFTLTVNGSNFVANSVVRWNGQSRTTTFMSASKLTANIPASDVATSGMAMVTVFNPAPGGGTSNAVTFNTLNPGGGNAPVVNDAIVSRTHGDQLVVDMDLTDSDGNIASIDVGFYQGDDLLFELTANSPDDIDLTGFTGGDLFIWIGPFGGDAGLIDRLTFQVADADAQMSDVFSSPVLDNLLENPGAEDGPASIDVELVPIPGWDPTGSFTVTEFGFDVDSAESSRIIGGTNFFTGGFGEALSEATQVVDVSSQATDIDAGKVTAVFHGFLAVYEDQEDTATLLVEFLDSDQNVLGGGQIGPESGTDTFFLLGYFTGVMPPGTRSVRVTMSSALIDVVDNFNDGFFDNLFFGNRVATP